MKRGCAKRLSSGIRRCCRPSVTGFMVQSLGAACHHLGQPATNLGMLLFLMKERAQTNEEMDEIDAGIREVEAISAVLQKLREVNEFHTEPYICGQACDENQILAI